MPYHPTRSVTSGRKLNVKKSLACLAVLALVAAAPAASAQFTTVVTPPKRPKAEEAPAVATNGQIARDTALNERLTDMKAWVDSAAVALSGKPIAPAPDSSARADTAMKTADSSTAAKPPMNATPASPAPAKFKDGAPAPDTATPIPFLLLAGAGFMAAGRWIRRR